ncbi:hypothetical protein SAMN02745244_01943 [Tessaracoccus bendigoensis DSM 12906]|uniref:Uncharacterized protein n=1 Tax=Tessaracoccus bendigoensis DSM 12906 TaxID=1123357 RepID=A0A1M6HCU0_9ACTN|nr:hypothetical protein [Tessaracoccus bendigoensis]SHJ20002.1 hypothetical protein SAMN02745244_01943 [Tessaracoccus bendigoensis DSM 12906]
MPGADADLLPQQVEEALTVLGQAEPEVSGHLLQIRSVIDEGLARWEGPRSSVMANAVARKLFEKVNSFESEGERLTSTELSAVLSTYLSNLRQPSLAAGSSVAGGWKHLPAPRAESLTVTQGSRGVVRIGSAFTESSGIVTLPLKGALLAVDIGDPEMLPSCEVLDVEIAAPVVAALYGDEVLRAVKTVSSGLDGHVAAPVSDAMIMGRLVNLACLRWCRETSPVELDDALLEAQELCLVGQLQDLLESPPAWEGRLAQVCGELIGREEPQQGSTLSRTLVEAAELLTGSSASRSGDWPETTDCS